MLAVDFWHLYGVDEQWRRSMSNRHFYDLRTSSYKMIYFYLIFISRHQHYLRLKVLQRCFIFYAVSRFVMPLLKVVEKP